MKVYVQLTCEKLAYIYNSNIYASLGSEYFVFMDDDTKLFEVPRLSSTKAKAYIDYMAHNCAASWMKAGYDNCFVQLKRAFLRFVHFTIIFLTYKKV